MDKRIIIFALFMSVLMVTPAFAQEATTTDEVIEEAPEEAEVEEVEEEEVEIEDEESIDLGVEEVGTLPDSPFYFFKEWGRNIRGAFIFNQVKKADFELEITNEKAAELQRLVELKPNSADAIERATTNYERASERLKARFERLSENSENPNVDELLDKLADRTARHEALFENLSERHQEVRERFNVAREKIEGVSGAVFERIESREDFRERVRSATEGKLPEEHRQRILQRIDSISEETGLTGEEVRQRFEERNDESRQRIESETRTRPFEIIDGMGEDAKQRVDSIRGDLKTKIEESRRDNSERFESRFELRETFENGEENRFRFRNRVENGGEDEDEGEDTNLDPSE
ncbi:MAG: DUF5667 domain-containing protein [Candidatus Colwellbacteria bacterium]